jgi:hypothetical protein
MIVMIGELRTQIDTVQRNLVLACEAGLPYEAHLHRARLQDLIEIAARHGIDTRTWVDRGSVTPPARSEE